MTELRIRASQLRELRHSLLGAAHEKCAVLLATVTQHAGGDSVLLVREVVYPDEAEHVIKAEDAAELSPGFVARVASTARRAGLALIFVHTHPGSGRPSFSPIDGRGELALAAFLERRAIEGPHAALVMSKGGLRARHLGAAEEVGVVSVGDTLRSEFTPDECAPDLDERFDRQVRAFGAEGQRALQRLRVAIVGLGGTGSIAAQQLVHLGVRDLLLIDPDVVEETNLNRVVNAQPADVGRPKVQVAQRYLEPFGARVETLLADVTHAAAAKRLCDVDVILACTDSHGSRSVIQQVAYQYLIPCIDIGSTILAKAGKVAGIYGRVQLLGPDHACLWCSDLLDPAQVRHDMMSERERSQDPYIPGAREPAPAVVSLNGTVVSLAVTMLLGLVTEAPIAGRHLIYDASTARLRSIRTEARQDCFLCSSAGLLAAGDKQALFARQA